jgi:hypothetical protein
MESTLMAACVWSWVWVWVWYWYHCRRQDMQCVFNILCGDLEDPLTTLDLSVALRANDVVVMQRFLDMDPDRYVTVFKEDVLDQIRTAGLDGDLCTTLHLLPPGLICQWRCVGEFLWAVAQTQNTNVGLHIWDAYQLEVEDVMTKDWVIHLLMGGRHDMASQVTFVTSIILNRPQWTARLTATHLQEWLEAAIEHDAVVDLNLVHGCVPDITHMVPTYQYTCCFVCLYLHLLPRSKTQI